MSGGSLCNYDQYKISEIAYQIEHLIENNLNEELDEWGNTKGSFYPEEVIQEFKAGLDILNKAFVYAQRIDWLISGDDGEESFLKRLKHDLQELEK